jgi:N-acetyl-gamma-glutamyl-phosphate reductase
VAEKVSWNDSFKAYGVTGHRHLPEIEQNINTSAVFIPHLLPLDRGIVATCYAKLEAGKTLAQAQAVFQKLADENIFVEYVTSPPELKNVIGTNKIQIYVCVDANAGHLIVISALDNLVKGAAGQAVQNMNVLLGWPEEQGLSNLQVLTDNHTL